MSKHISLASYELEAAARAEGYAHVCGADEAGAGPLMGPVYAAAVILPEGCVIEGLDDSKKLSEKKREALFDIIRERAVAYSVASVDAREIDEIDILNARMKAMQLAIDGLNVKADFALIDGNRDHGTEIRRLHAAPHGRRRRRREHEHRRGIDFSQGQPRPLRDRRAGQAISAVSICKAQGLWNQAALRHARRVRPMPLSPKDFSQKVGGGETMSTTREAGDRGEAMAAEYLRENGYEILASQFRCRFGEIDLIARRGDILCFVEVKLRSDRRFGLPRDFVTTAKQRRIRTTAAFYMTRHDPDLCARFDVAEVYDDETPPRIEYIENAFE